MTDQLDLARAKVDDAFKTFIANSDAVYTIKRALTVAIANAPDPALPVMSKTILLMGPASVGKTEIARRICKVLDLPFVRIDGRVVKSRERLFAMIDAALSAHKPPLTPEPAESQQGVPVYIYPPFVVFIDEVHLVASGTQEAFLTMLEADDREIVLDGDRGRRVARVGKACFVFATTKPSELDKAFRSRCIEVQLSRYTTEEVAEMVKQRYGHLPPVAIETIASASRGLPRVAFSLAEEVREEIIYSNDGDNIRGCVKRVLKGRGVIFNNGITKNDLRYLKVLGKEGRPIGEGVIKSALYDVEENAIGEDLEPFLMASGFITITSRGRILTADGEMFLRQANRTLEREA